MKLNSFGCSFIFGSDLPDDGRERMFGTPSKYTWPSLIAEQLGYEHHCYARPGIGNLRIMERVIAQAAKPDPAVFIVGWTWIDRYDYTNAKDNTWSTIMPVDENRLSKTYYRDLHSQFRDKLTTLVNIKVTIDTLKQHGHKFVMTYMDDLIFETKWHTSPAVTELQEYIRPYMTQFDGKTFLEWSDVNGYAISPTKHPLEEAHQAAASYILNQSFS
jgi:hypothetical protein